MSLAPGEIRCEHASNRFEAGLVRKKRGSRREISMETEGILVSFTGESSLTQSVTCFHHWNRDPTMNTKCISC